MEQANKKQVSPENTETQFSPVTESLKRRVAGTIATFSLLDPAKPLLVAVSGGADSISLLHLLSTLFPDSKRTAVYIDHGLRPEETPAEQTLVARFAKSCSASFHTVSVDVQTLAKTRHLSIEDAARTLRYLELERIGEELQAGCIAVGHTADDQAEEILLRLIRGSGCKGLAGMEIERGMIIRPLLHEKKETLLQYLGEQDIPFCEDSSNTDLRFLRNKIRRKLLPELEQSYNKTMRRTLLQTASILREDDRLLQKITEDTIQQQVQRNQNPSQLLLNLSLFCTTHPAIQRRIMEYICWQMEAKPSFTIISNLINLAQGKKDGEIHLSRGLRANKQAKRIIFHHPAGKQPYRGASFVEKHLPPLLIPSPGRYPVPELGFELLLQEIETATDLRDTDQLYLDASTLSFPFILRAALPGERFHPLGAPGRKKVSRFLSDQKIPKTAREEFPLLLHKDSIVAVMGLRIEEQFRVRAATQEVLLLQWKKVPSSKLLHKNI